MRQLFLYAVIVLGSMAAASVLQSCAGDQRPSAPSYLPDNSAGKSSAIRGGFVEQLHAG
jgi:hypothetical protein